MDALNRHEKIALSFSGGKDSLACVYLLRDYLDSITVYHLDTGDAMPETADVVAHVRNIAPRFVYIQGDVDSWIADHGMPSDLVPYTAHPIAAAAGHVGPKIVSRYECCFHNLMWPVYSRIKADGNTLLIRGTKRADMARLPVASGETDDGIEMLHPVEDWSDARVLDYLRSVDAPVSRLYEHGANTPDCARCSGYWNEGRMAYLRQFHPGLWSDYSARMRVVMGAIEAPARMLLREMEAS